MAYYSLLRQRRECRLQLQVRPFSDPLLLLQPLAAAKTFSI